MKVEVTVTAAELYEALTQLRKENRIDEHNFIEPLLNNLWERPAQIAIAEMNPDEKIGGLWNKNRGENGEVYLEVWNGVGAGRCATVLPTEPIRFIYVER